MNYAAITRWCLVLAVTTIASACAPDAATGPEDAFSSRAEAPKTNKVTLTTLTQNIYFARGATALSPSEAHALEQFASATIRPGDHLTVTLAQTPLAARRQASIARLLPNLSTPVVFRATQDSSVAATPDTAVLQVGRYAVIPPNCPDWTKPEADDFTNSPSSNFGCANAMNIGLMVADPADLVRGQEPGGADAAFAARGVEQYRSGAISKSLSALSDTSTPGSGGGQGGGGSGGGGGS